MSTSFVTPWTVACQAPLSTGSSGTNTGAGCYFLLQGIFLTQGSNSSLLHWQADSLKLSHQGSPMSSTISSEIRWQQITTKTSDFTWRNITVKSVKRYTTIGDFLNSKMLCGNLKSNELSLFTEPLLSQWRVEFPYVSSSTCC